MPPRLRHVIRDLVSATLWSSGLTRPARLGDDRLVVVTFHRVLPEEQRRRLPFPDLAVTPEELAWFLGFFERHFRCATLTRALTGWSAGERDGRSRLAITFDDGQRDNLVHARPALAAAGVPATFFVVTDAVGREGPLWPDRLARLWARHCEPHPRRALAWLDALDGGATAPASPTGTEGVGLRDSLLLPGACAVVERVKACPWSKVEPWLQALEAEAGPPEREPFDGLMGWDDLRTLRDEGHEIGGHSATHPILPRCDDARLEQELRRCQDELTRQLGRPASAFAYPNGDHDPRCRRAAAEAGFRVAVTTAWGTNRHDQDPLLLNRCDISGSTSRTGSGRLSAERLAWRLSDLHPRIPT